MPPLKEENRRSEVEPEFGEINFHYFGQQYSDGELRAYLESATRKHSKPFLTTGLIIWIFILLTVLLVPLLFQYFGFQPAKC